MANIENIKEEAEKAVQSLTDFFWDVSETLENLAIDEQSAQQIISLIQQSGFEEAFVETLSNIGVKYGIRVYIGDYGNGRTLIIQEDIDEDKDQNWYDYEDYGGVGGWFPSSAGC